MVTGSGLWKSFQIDIEGGEWSSGGFSDWLSSGVLHNVDQMALAIGIILRMGLIR